MTKKALLILLICLLIFTVLPLVTQAQNKGPYVYAILFYSPSCPHCHKLITEDLPPIQKEFGSDLRVVPIDVTTEAGNYLASSAYQTYEIPQDRWVVPMMIIDNRVLIGGDQIPAELPGITREGLANNGIPLPDFPGMEEISDTILKQYGDTTTGASSDSGVSATSLNINELSLSERLSNDPANLLALAVLVGLVVTAGAGVYTLVRARANEAIHPLLNKVTQPIVLFTVLVSIGIAFTLVSANKTDALATPIAWGLLIVMVVVFFGMLVAPNRMDLMIPVVSLAGMADAFYLSYVELTNTEAACGLVGNCNMVQSSPYAMLFGILPIGVFGIIGYIVILGLYTLSRSKNPRNVTLANAGMLAAVLFGVLFSLYLTFLEPFVIGATCMWCIFSALMMLLLFWMVLPTGWEALRDMFSTTEPMPKRA